MILDRCRRAIRDRNGASQRWARSVVAGVVMVALACSGWAGAEDAAPKPSNPSTEPPPVEIESLGEVQRLSPPQFPALVATKDPSFVVGEGPAWQSPGPRVLDLEFTPDAKRLLAWLDDGTIELLDTELNSVGKLSGGATTFPHYAFSTDGKRLLVDEVSGEIGVWNLETRQKERSLTGHPDGVRCVAVSFDRRLGASGGNDGVIRVWNLETGAEISAQQAQSLGVPDHVWFNERCSHIYWVRGGTQVGRSEISDFAAQEELLKTDDQVIGVAQVYHNRSGALLSLRGGNAVYVGANVDRAHPTPHDITSWTCRFPFQQMRYIVSLPGNLHFAGYCGDTSYEVRRANGNHELSGVSQGDTSNSGPIAIARSGRLAATGYHDGRIRLFHLPQPSLTPFDDYDQFRRQVREARDRRDIERLEAIATEVQDVPIDWETQERKLTLFMDQLSRVPRESDEEYQSLLELLGDWRTAHPDSLVAANCLADSWRRYAWFARGGAPAVAVGKAQFETFFNRLEEAQTVLEEAAKLETKSAALYASWITVGMGRQQKKQDLLELYDTGLSIDPTCLALHAHIVVALLPRWGGELGEVARLAERVADKVGGDDGEYLYGLFAQCLAQSEGGLTLETHGFDIQRVMRATKVMRQRSFRSYGPQNIAFLAACFAGDQAEARDCAAVFRSPVDSGIWQRRALERYLAWTRRPAPKNPPRKSLLVGWQAVSSMACSHTDSTIAVAGNGFSPPVRFWDADTGESIPANWPIRFRSVEFTPDDNDLVGDIPFGKRTAFAKVDLVSREATPLFNVDTPVDQWAISDDGKITATADEKGKITFHPADDTSEMDFGERVWRVGFSVGGDRVVAVGQTGKGTIFDLKTGVKVASLDQLTPNIPPLALFSKGLATGGQGSIRLYSHQGEVELELSSPTEPDSTTWYTAVAVSHDGRRLAAATFKGSATGQTRYDIELWDLDTKKLLAQWDYHFDTIHFLAFTFDDRTVVSMADDGHVCLWDTAAVGTP